MSGRSVPEMAESAILSFIIHIFQEKYKVYQYNQTVETCYLEMCEITVTFFLKKIKSSLITNTLLLGE